MARVAAAAASASSELAALRAEHDGRLRDMRDARAGSRGAEARLASLQELASSHADFGDAARVVLAQANGPSASAARWPTISTWIGATSAPSKPASAICCSTSSSNGHEQAAAGLSLVRGGDAGRCGFVVLEPAPDGRRRAGGAARRRA